MRAKETITHFLGWIPFKVGEWSFPVLEPLLRVFDNWDAEVKKYYVQALKSLETGKTAIALLNLNMVISLNPKHFLAHVQRGRIYLREKRFRLASDDLLKASRISRYRFVHYDLFREYSKSVNQESGDMELSLPGHLNHFPRAMQKAEDHMQREFESEEVSPDRFSGILSRLKDGEEPDRAENFSFSEDEREIFDALGPITCQEIEETDWDQLSRKLSS